MSNRERKPRNNHQNAKQQQPQVNRRTVANGPRRPKPSPHATGVPMLSIEECREDGRLWIKFKEAFRTWISINHCDFLSITDSEGKYPKAEKPAEIAKNSSDLAEKIYLEEYRTSLKKSEKYEEAKPKIYGALYGSLEECSQVKIREDADWQRCEDHHHPLQLYKLVEKVHLRPRSTGIAENDQDEAVDYYNNLRQAASEPLHEYHQKITAALDTLKAIGAPIPTAEEQGRRVVKSLDPSRYVARRAPSYSYSTITF